jgi:MarR family transcriptional regulator, organic hydroperoxide resistance regulator
VERFAEAWDAFVLAIRRAQARGPQSADDLTLAQYYLLGPLETEPGFPLSRLAESAGIAPPTATRIVDGLEKAGIVRRDRSRTDRRTVLVSLTAAGQRQVASKRAELADRRRRLYENLEPDERIQSERLLRHLAELIAQL